jgi:hypothetical protein
MNRSDDHLQDAVPTQKLEWVTPKISLMVAGHTLSKTFPYPVEDYFFDNDGRANAPS